MTALRSTLALGLIAAAIAGIGACGGEDDGDTAAAGTTEEESGSTELARDEQEAVDRYREFSIANAEDHRALMEDFMDAVEADEIETAKDIYPEARRPWERIEPIAAAFGDLDPALDAREGDVPKDTWGGWHYFEKALWVDESTKGLEPYIEESKADADTLVEAAETLELTPPEIAQGAVDLLGEVSSSKITGEEERYSHTDLWDFEANVEGSEEAFEAVAPLLDDPGLEDEVRERFADVYAGLDEYREGDGFVLYTDLDEADTRALSRQIDALAEPLSQVAGGLG